MSKVHHQQRHRPGPGTVRCASSRSLYQLSPLDRRQPVNELRHTHRQPAVNDQNATNVAAIVISGEHRNTANGVVIMPAFGNAYSDTAIAAVANYVTGRFGAKGSRLIVKTLRTVPPAIERTRV